MKYLPVQEAQDGCPNGECECGSSSRFRLLDETDEGGFGIQFLTCTQHPYGDTSLAEMERKIQKSWGDFSSFHPFMDYNLGLWAPNLGDYMTKFTEDGVSFLPLKWRSDDGRDYYSLLVNPCGYVVIELMGDQVGYD